MKLLEMISEKYQSADGSPLCHNNGCDVKVRNGMSLLKGFHFFENAIGSPLFHIIRNPLMFRALATH